MKSNNKTSRKIAKLLIEIIYIPNGHTVQSLFGDGSEASDLDAMTFWVESNINEINAQDTIQRLQHITRSKQITLGGSSNATM
ncbi:hypothetical protein MMIC_P2127 [Mariprofundus micogutta]|uniref:Uncharacterized protein n=1 Tax=Mariprofundus micogutta TaxID=1921010 RepID=A0A1L8CQH9_9PROT|nr:hypothetical protein [Mariprofundus micogutta]GAV21147.1 hypothetical protein MMIC_P2127 [Mariprofundus micogutta]